MTTPLALPVAGETADNAGAHLPLTQDSQPPLIDSTTEHYSIIGTHCSLWSGFLTSVQQERVLERAFVALNSTSTHCHVNRKYTGSLRNTDASIFGSCWVQGKYRIRHITFIAHP